MGMAEATAGLGAVGTASDLACKMGLTDIELTEPCTSTKSTPMLGAYVREGLLFGARSLGCAAPGAFTLSVERAVAIYWVPWVDAEGCVVVSRGLAGMVLAIGRVNSGPPDGIVDMLLVAAYDPTLLAATGGHRIGSPQGSCTRHKGVDDFDVVGHFDRWVTELGVVVVGQQCLSVLYKCLT